MRKINLPVFVFLLILVGVKGDLGFLSISEDSEDLLEDELDFDIIDAEKDSSINSEDFLSKVFTNKQQESLNWKTLVESMKLMHKNILSIKDIEAKTFEVQDGVFESLISLSERLYGKQKVDVAKFQEKIDSTLIPYKRELEESLKNKANLLEQQNQDLQFTEDDRATQKKSYKSEMDDLSEAVVNLDKMLAEIDEQLKNLNSESNFIQMKSNLFSLHVQLEKIYQHSRNEESPLLTLTASLQSLLQSDFRSRKTLKEIQDLLNKLRTLTLDTRLELIYQNQKNQQLYQERKATIEADKQNNIELYNSKKDQYEQVTMEIQRIKDLLEQRKSDEGVSEQSLSFFKNVWATNQGIYNRIDRRLTDKSASIEKIVKNSGEGVEFEGRAIE